MSKKKQLENLAVLIGLRAAHEILIEFTNKPESIKHLRSEVDNYSDLSFELAEGNWNKDDIKKIKELAKKRCNKKLKEYEDINCYNKVDGVIDDVMLDLGLIV